MLLPRAGYFRQLGDLILELGIQLVDGNAEAGKQSRNDPAIFLASERQKQMGQFNLLLAVLRSQFLGFLQRFLGLYG